MSIILVIAAVVLLFGAAIFVHEFGHYWVARRRGMKVEAFAIGFGPKIFGWTKDGIEYSWRWIPAGGYVKLPQMITSEALEGEKASSEHIPPASPLDKILVAFAGPFMNVVFAFVIATFLYFVGLPVLVNPPIVGYVEPGSAEAELGIRDGDVIVSVDHKKVKSWQDVNMYTILAHTNVLPVVIKQDGQEKTFQLKAEIKEPFRLKILNLDPRDHPEVAQVLPGTPAEEAGVQPGDEIVSFGGVPIHSQLQLTDLIKKSGGQTTEMRVQRAGEKIALMVTPQFSAEANAARIGVAFSFKHVYMVEKPGPTPWVQVKDVWDKTIYTISALVHSKKTGVGAKDLSGPVGIFAMLAGWVSTDYRLALSFLVLLNINLAILNLLPVPVLDGGHIMMAIVEKIRRRPMSVRFVEYTTTVFAVMLISFMLYVTFFDIKRISLFRAMFKSESQIHNVETGVAPAETAPAP